MFGRPGSSFSLNNSDPGPRVSELAGAPPDVPPAAGLTLAYHKRVLT